MVGGVATSLCVIYRPQGTTVEGVVDAEVHTVGVEGDYRAGADFAADDAFQRVFASGRKRDAPADPIPFDGNGVER